jgi:hypothetical protein
MVVGLVLIAGASVAIGHWRMERDLHATLAQLEKDGERLSLKSLAHACDPAAPPWFVRMSNSAVRLRQIQFDQADSSLMTATGPGYAMPLWQSPCWFDWRGVKRNWTNVAEALTEAEPVLAELREMLRNPPKHSGIDYTAGPARAPHYPTIQTVFHWLALAMEYKLHSNDLNGALEYLNAIVSLPRLHEQDQSVAAQLIRLSASRGAYVATWDALQAPGFNEAQLLNLQMNWAELHLADKFPGAFEMERALKLAKFELARKNGLGRVNSTPDFRNPISILHQTGLFSVMWRFSWCYGDEKYYLRNMQADLRAFRCAANGNTLADIKSACFNGLDSHGKDLGPLQAHEYELSRQFLFNVQPIVQSVLRSEAQRQLTLAAIAVKCYQLNHASLPRSLDELAPELIAAVPGSALNGKPLDYEIRGQGTFIISSEAKEDMPPSTACDWPAQGEALRLVGPKPEVFPLIEVDDQTVTNALVELARKARLNVEFEPRAAALLIDTHEGVLQLNALRLEKVTAFAALAALAEAYGLSVCNGRNSKTVLITKKSLWEEAAEAEAPIRGKENAKSQEDVVPLIVIEDVPVLDAIRNLARQVGQNIIFDADVSRKFGRNTEENSITVRFENIAASEALEKILKSHQLKLKRHLKSGIGIITSSS